MKIGIVGMGPRGQQHLKAASRLAPDGPIWGYDPFLSPEEVKRRGAWPAATLDQFCGSVEAVVVACCHETLAPLALEMLNRGKHCLVEKPGAMGLSDAQALSAAATRSGRVLLFGFAERFHILAQRALLDVGNLSGPILLLLRRHGGTLCDRPRLRSLVDDVMIHDIDFALRVFREKKFGTTLDIEGYYHNDFASVLLSGQCDVSVVLESSRGVFPPARSIIVTATDSIHTYDLYRGVHQARTRIHRDAGLPPASIFRERYSIVEEIVLQSDIVMDQMASFLTAITAEAPFHDSVVDHRHMVERIVDCVAQ